MTLLDVARVTMEFGGLTALSEVSFQVVPGEVLGLIGPNGAGKTTLFNVITALFPPTAGEILFDGKSIRGLSTHEIAERGIVRTFQNIRLFPLMTVAENVMDRQLSTAAGDGVIATAIGGAGAVIVTVAASDLEGSAWLVATTEQTAAAAGAV